MIKIINLFLNQYLHFTFLFSFILITTTISFATLRPPLLVDLIFLSYNLRG